MSYMPAIEPECRTELAPAVALEIEGRTRELGDGMTVRRLLPSTSCRMVGPFIFVDHMGPVEFAAGQGLDVRPHPHIHLATVTFLFDGEILHRDSLGTEQPIRPGAVNWMTAGRGIVHSERTPAVARKSSSLLHGMQLWVALPTSVEQTEPSFEHHAPESLPTLERSGVRLRLIAGSAYGETSPVRVLSPLFYVEARLERASELLLPDDYRGRAAYVVLGAIAVDGRAHAEGRMIVFRQGATARIRALERSHLLLLGGAPVDGERYIWWNFVSSSTDSIEQASKDWRNGRFPKVPGDDKEFIPLPEVRPRL